MLAEREDSVCGAGRAALGSGDSWSTSQENRSRALLWPAPAGRNPGCPGDAGSPPLWCFRETRPLCFHIHKMGLPPPFSWPHTSLSVPQGILSPVLMVPGCWGLRAGNAATILRTHSWGAGANAGQEGRGGGGGHGWRHMPAGVAGCREEACGQSAGSALPNIFIPCIFSFSREFSSTRRSKAADASPGGTLPPGS